MKKLLIIAQSVDDQDPIIGFFIGWLKEFSRYFDKVRVITLRKGSYNLPANVEIISLGKEEGTSKVVQLFKLLWNCFKFVPKSSGVFIHMSPKFTALVWPFTLLFRKKLILWYLHRSAKLRHRISYLLCDYIVTAAKESLGIRGPKIIELGHGIDINKFVTARPWRSKNELAILTEGRITPIKNLDVLIRALKVLTESGLKANLTVVGPPMVPGDFKYFEDLKELVEELDLESRVKFTGGVPFESLPPYFQAADYFVGLTPTGGVDKAPLEAMASGCIVFTSNEVFKKYFGDHSKDLVFKFRDHDDLAEKIKKINSFSETDKSNLSGFLVASVRSHHGLERVVKEISDLYLA